LLADIELQKTKVVALEQQFARMKLLIGKGYLSRLDWLQFETNLITEKQNLSRHIQNRIQLSNSMGDSRKQLEAIDDGSKQRQQEIDLQLSQLATQQLQYNRQAHQNLAAPVEGKISHISVSRGAAVMPGESILFISTNIKQYSATLNIPSSAAGFVNVGQSLELEIDAFPAQRFGRVNATITQLTNHTVNSQTRNSKQQSRSFVARLAIDRTSLDQFGEGKVLPGMRFTSHIALDRKTLFMWFAEPLLKLLDRV
jgi:membrane fusion protein